MAEEYGNHLSFPFHIGSDGRTARVSTLEDHVREELIQLLLTNPGERLFLPEFGGGVRRLVFEGADAATAGITKAALTQNISRWLGDRITLEDLQVTVENEKIEVEIKYRLAGKPEEDTRIMRFQRKGG
jgi:phage baseplate assembly protein W